jgi:hypothetical protein
VLSKYRKNNTLFASQRITSSAYSADRWNVSKQHQSHIVSTSLERGLRSKNSKPLTRAEREHLLAVKSLPCSLCDAPPPSSAHHIKQGRHFATVSLCYACHQGSGGWHGDKTWWRIRKMDELDALNVTLSRLA